MVNKPSSFSSYYTPAEEIANGVTHGFGALLSLAGAIVLILFAVFYGNAWHIISFSVFSATLLLLYLASTLYHSVSNLKIKRALQIMDHAAIYLLIAGSYTPFILVNLRNAFGLSFLSVIWGCALLGVILKLVCIEKFKALSMGLYVGMGWLCVVVFKALLPQLSRASIILLVLGGLSYTFGLIFYGWEKLRYSHAVWHVFVLMGSIFHYFSVLGMV